MASYLVNKIIISYFVIPYSTFIVVLHLNFTYIDLCDIILNYKGGISDEVFGVFKIRRKYQYI
jgi:hypothetical protein